MLSSRIHSSGTAAAALATEWDEILRSCYRGVLGPDATCAAFWAQSLEQTHLKDADVRTLVISAGDRTLGIVPAHFVKSSWLRRELRTVTSVYSGRNGFVMRDNDPQTLEFALDKLRTDISGWDVFTCSVVENSASHLGLVRAARNLRLPLRYLGRTKSPYIELAGSWDEVFAALPKKMRWTIRKSERDLQAKGELSYREVRNPAEVAALMTDLYEIEQASWKEASGTSITTQQRQQAFYDALAMNAARSGTLSAHVLRLGSEPIAHIFGIEAGDGVFLDLKETFKDKYSEHSPGHVLKRFAFESLIGRGVRIYDFMGNCDPYKMRWTDKTYESLTVAIYNRTLRGMMAYLPARLRKDSVIATTPGSN